MGFGVGRVAALFSIAYQLLFHPDCFASFFSGDDIHLTTYLTDGAYLHR